MDKKDFCIKLKEIYCSLPNNLYCIEIEETIDNFYAKFNQLDDNEFTENLKEEIKRIASRI